jgi:hypothetical protein
MTSREGPSQVLKNRPSNPFKGLPLPNGDWQKLHDVLNTYGAAWETWGKAVLTELDALEAKNGGHENEPGGPPTDATQPPKPPFKP